jgi:protein-L-isoaspartate(D-aspartate) O-methyltransferase
MRPSSSDLRRRLVEHLRHNGFLRDERVARAFLDVPREAFLPEQLRDVGLAGIYRDQAIVTRRDPDTNLPLSSSSQPAIMALMLEMLDARPGHRVVEIGAGTGYNAALLDRLTRPGGTVFTVDVDPGVARQAAAGLREVGARVQVLVADGTQHLPLTRPVDRMEVTASASALPRAWHDQLVPGGRLVVPLRLSDEPDRSHVVTALARVAGGFDSVALTPGGFMPLRRPGGSPFPGVDLSRLGPWTPPPPSDPRAPALTRGPCPGIGKDDLRRLRITVRYDGAPKPLSRWAFRREDHWIGLDLDDDRWV